MINKNHVIFVVFISNVNLYAFLSVYLKVLSMMGLLELKYNIYTSAEYIFRILDAP